MLRLLPLGPDRVGTGFARRQPPAPTIAGFNAEKAEKFYSERQLPKPVNDDPLPEQTSSPCLGAFMTSSTMPTTAAPTKSHAAIVPADIFLSAFLMVFLGGAFLGGIMGTIFIKPLISVKK